MSLDILLPILLGYTVLDDPCRSRGKKPPHFGEFASHFEPVIANQCVHWCGNPFLFAPPQSPAVLRTAGFPDAACRILSKTCLHNLFADPCHFLWEQIEPPRTRRKRRRSGSNLSILCQQILCANRAVSSCFGMPSMLNYY